MRNNFSTIIRECIGSVTEVQGALDDEGLEFLGIGSIKRVGFSDFCPTAGGLWTKQGISQFQKCNSEIRNGRFGRDFGVRVDGGLGVRGTGFRVWVWVWGTSQSHRHLLDVSHRRSVNRVGRWRRVRRFGVRNRW